MSSHRVIPSALLNFAQLALALLVIVTGLALAKPPGPPQPPPLPNVRYAITRFQMPSFDFAIRNMNNSGVLCGNYRATSDDPSEGYLYDAMTGQFYNLNQVGLLSNLDAQTVAAGWGIGWSFAAVNEINDLGDFVGTLYSPDLTVQRGFLVETSSSSDPSDPSTWTVRLLPTFGSDWESGGDINEMGIVLGQFERLDGTLEIYVYDSHAPVDPSNPWTLNVPDAQHNSSMLNNLGQIVGDASPQGFTSLVYYYDPISGLDVYQLGNSANSSSIFNGLNDSGDTSGGTYLNVPRPNGKGTVLQKVVFNSKDLDVVATGDVWALGRAGLNESGDVHFSVGLANSVAHFAHTGFAAGDPVKVWKLNDLVNSADPLRGVWLQAKQTSIGITNRDSTGYPMVAVESTSDTGPNAIFVLIPFVPNQ